MIFDDTKKNNSEHKEPIVYKSKFRTKDGKERIILNTDLKKVMETKAEIVESIMIAIEEETGREVILEVRQDVGRRLMLDILDIIGNSTEEKEIKEVKEVFLSDGDRSKLEDKYIEEIKANEDKTLTNGNAEEERDVLAEELSTGIKDYLGRKYDTVHSIVILANKIMHQEDKYKELPDTEEDFVSLIISKTSNKLRDKLVQTMLELALEKVIADKDNKIESTESKAKAANLLIGMLMNLSNENKAIAQKIIDTIDIHNKGVTRDQILDKFGDTFKPKTKIKFTDDADNLEITVE